MEKSPETVQLSLLMPEVGERRFDSRIDDFRIIYRAHDEQVQPRADAAYDEPTEHPRKGVSLSLKEYYETRKRMIQEAAAANARRAYGAHTDTAEGFNEAYRRYGNDVFSVREGAERNAGNLQRKMDELFLVEELIAAGFAAEAIRRASRENTEAINRQFVGTANAPRRKAEYKYLDRKIEEFSD